MRRRRNVGVTLGAPAVLSGHERDRDRLQRNPNHHPHQIQSLGAQCEPYAEVAPRLADILADDAVDPDRNEQERHGGERREQRRTEKRSGTCAKSRCFAHMTTTRSCSRTGSGRSRIALATEKAAVETPMPTASVATAIAVNAGARRADLSAKRISWLIRSIPSSEESG